MSIGKSPYLTVCSRPRTVNKQSNFEDMLVKSTMEYCNEFQEKGIGVVLLNTSVGGVTCKYYFPKK